MKNPSTPQDATTSEDDRDTSVESGGTQQYISTRQAAQILGVNRATVINWARQGRFNAIQYGARGIYRFERSEIVAFLDRSRLQSSDQSE